MAQEPVDRVAEALDATQPPETARRTGMRPTDPWTPGLDIDGDEGVLTTDRLPDGEDPEWAAIFAYWGLDPDHWYIADEGNLRVNAWQMPGPDGELRVHRQYKATIRRRTVALADRFDADGALGRLAKWKPSRMKPVETGGATWVVNAADWQIGGRGGTAAFEDRFQRALAELVVEARAKRKAGVTDLLVGYLGDMAEGSGGNYPSQAFEVDLDRDDQTRMVAAFEMVMLRELAPFFARTTAVAVPGNHGRNNQNYETGEHDVTDVTSFKWAASLLVASGEAEKHNLTFVLPEKHNGTLMARVETSGTRILFAHGHKTKGDASRLRTWWRDVSFSRYGDSDASDHLITGHRHHVHVEECSADRWLFVCPTLGAESNWFHDGGGPTSRPGILHYTTRDRLVRDVSIAAGDC